MVFRSIAILIIVYSQFLFAQITVTADDILGQIGSTHNIETDTTGSININVGTAGSNQSWDFSSVPVQGIASTISYINPSGTPFTKDFSEANFVQYSDFFESGYTGKSYTYTRVTPNLLITLGTGITVSNPDTQFVLTQTDSVPLSVTYGTNWTSSSSDTTDVGFGSYIITSTESMNTVDAWGTVTLSQGSYQCLRVREDYNSTTQTVFNGQVLFSQTTEYISYYWISKNAYFLVTVESLDGETNPNFTTAASFSRLIPSNPSALPKTSDDLLPQAFTLEQNYPNPFNPTTSIPYNLDRSEFVSIEVYDQNGQLVKTLVSEYKSAGIYEVIWDGTNNLGTKVASGPYFYTLSVGNQKISTRQMFLIK